MLKHFDFMSLLYVWCLQQHFNIRSGVYCSTVNLCLTPLQHFSRHILNLCSTLQLSDAAAAQTSLAACRQSCQKHVMFSWHLSLLLFVCPAHSSQVQEPHLPFLHTHPGWMATTPNLFPEVGIGDADTGLDPASAAVSN